MTRPYSIWLIGMDSFTRYCLTGYHTDLRPVPIKDVGDITDNEPKWIHDRGHCYKISRKYTELADWPTFHRHLMTETEISTMREWLAWTLEREGVINFDKALWITGDTKRSVYPRKHVVVGDIVDSKEGDSKKGDDENNATTEKTKLTDARMTQYFTPTLTPVYKRCKVAKVTIDDVIVKDGKMKKTKIRHQTCTSATDIERDAQEFSDWIKTKPIDKHLLTTMTHEEVDKHKNYCRIRL